MKRRWWWLGLVAVTVIAAAVWTVGGVESIERDSGYAVADGVWFGGEPRLLEPGRHFLPPGMAAIHRYPTDDQVADFSSDGIAFAPLGGTPVDFRARLTFRISPEGVLRVHRESRGASVVETVVRPAAIRVLDGVSRDTDGPAVGTPAFRSKVREALDLVLASSGIELVAMSEVDGRPDASDPVPRARVASRNLLVIGLDGADWDLIDPLVESGDLPNLGRLAREGARARLRTITPVLSPVVWTSVATGKRPSKHGIFDFLATARDGSMVPVTSTLWQARPLWSILGDAGVPVAITAWWATWPAEPVRGLMATDRIAYQLFRNVISEPSSSDPVSEARGKTWPAELFDELAPLIVKPAEIGDRDLARFIDLDALGRADRDDRERLDEFRTVLASTRTYESIGRKLLEKQRRGFHAIYNESTDTAAHLFMPFRPPRRADVDDRRAAAFGGVVDAVYREADAQVGRLLDDVGPDWDVAIISDHGFRHGDNRPSTDPRVDHGPAADWHDRFGVLILWGPDIRRGAVVADASILDVAPTVLALYGLPTADDMDGRVLEEAFEPAFLAEEPPVPIATYERGRREPRVIDPSAQDPALMEKLRALGYITGGGTAEGTPGAGAPPESGEFSLDGSRASINRGVALMAQLDLEAAQLEFERALEAGGGITALTNLFNVHILRRDLDSAEATLERIERLSPRVRSLPGLKGAVADLRGERAEAERLLREAIRIDPADSRAHNRLGHILESAGKLDEALAEYRAAVRGDPNSAESHNYVGNIMRMKGEPGGAKQSYRKAIAADPRYPGAYNNLGLMLQQEGELDEAIRLYRKGLEQAPRSGLLHNSLASVLILERKLDEAEREVRLAIEYAPRMAEAHNNLGILLAERSRPGEALIAFERSIEVDPTFVDAHFNLAKALLLVGQRERALEAFVKTVELDPRHLDAAIGAGEIAYQSGRDHEAFLHFERARKIRPNIPRLRERLGELYLRQGDRERAVAEWRRSLELSPNQPELRKRLEELASDGR